MPIDNIKFNNIKIDEINLNFLKKYLRRINVESNIKIQKNKFFKTLMELQNIYIDDTAVWVIKINLDGKRKQTLPEVASIEVSDVFETKFTYKKKKYDAYLVSLKWTYTKDNDYQKKIKLTLINDNNILYIVKGE